MRWAPSHRVTPPRSRCCSPCVGYTQAFSSLGGLMVAFASSLAATDGSSLPPIAGFGIEVPDPHVAWRYTLMSGVLPAIPLILIRPFLPESPVWQRKRAEGTLRRPSLAALFAPDLRRTTVVTTLMFAMSYGAAFGAIQQLPQIVPGLADVREMTAGATAPEARAIEQRIASDMTKVQEVGGLAGRLALAWLAVVIVSRRQLIRVFQLPGLLIMPLVFGWAATGSLAWLTAGAFAAAFAWVTATLSITPDRAAAPARVAMVAACVGFGVYVIGFIASFWLPEPPEKDID